MAVTQAQKVDYLWKKLGYGRTKTDTNSIKKAFNESIASPLLIRGDTIWQSSNRIPTSIPGSSSGVVTVYPTSAPVECSADITASSNRTWKTGITDWISPEFGSTYLIKVYVHTSGDAAGASGGDVLLAAGSGNDDEWFFDYQSGVLNFIGDNLPNGVNFSGKSVYISGAVYSGTLGLGAIASGTFTGITTFTDTTDNDLGNADTGSVQIDGGLGVNKNVTVGANLNVQGYSEFVGVATFRGGAIGLGDQSSDTITVGGQFASGLFPDTDGAYDLGDESRSWRNLNLSGVATATSINSNSISLTNAGVAVTAILDETDLSSDRSDALATQHSIKAYVDAAITAEDLDFAGDTGTGAVDFDSQTFSIVGTSGEIETSASSQTLTIGLPNTVIVGTAVSTPIVKTPQIQHSGGTNAVTIDSSGNVVAEQNLTINGSLFVKGSTTQVNTEELTVFDRTLTLGIQTGATSSTTTWDLGVLMNYGDAGVAKTAGVIWEYGVERFVFSANSNNPSSSDTSSPNITVSDYAAIEVGSLWLNDCAGQSQVISCTGSERFLENITIDAGTF